MSLGWIQPGKLREFGMLGMNCRNVEFINRYNERRLYPLVDNKLKTKLLAELHGVATPGLKFVVREQHELRGIEQQLIEQERFVVKPAKGSGGKGILVVTGRDGEEYRKSSGASVSVGAIRRHMSNILAGLYSLGGASDVVIIEDLISLDDSFRGYSYQGVPDIRIVVFRGYPVMAMLRLSTRSSDGKANLHQGAVGVGLALDTGTALNAVQHGSPLHEHPDTGRVLAQIAVPEWRDMLLLAAKCHDMTGLGYLGTDLVLDKSSGPQLLELNARPGLAIQIANGSGLLPRLRHVETLPDSRHWPAEKRVDYVMQRFADGGSAADSDELH